MLSVAKTNEMKQLHAAIRLRNAFKTLKPGESVIQWWYLDEHFCHILRSDTGKGCVNFTLYKENKKTPFFITLNSNSINGKSVFVNECMLDNILPDLLEPLATRLVVEAVRQSKPVIRWKREQERDLIALLEGWGAEWHNDLELDLEKNNGGWVAVLLAYWKRSNNDPAGPGKLLDLGVAGGAPYYIKINEQKKVSNFKLETVSGGVIEIDLDYAYPKSPDIGTGFGYNIDLFTLFDCLSGHVLINAYERKAKVIQGNFYKETSDNFLHSLEQFGFEVKQGARINVAFQL